MAFGQYTATTALVQMIPANPKRIATLIRSMPANSTTAFLKMDASTGTTATTSTLMPIQPGESILLTSNFGFQLGSADWGAAVAVISGTGGEDIRWIDF